MKTRLLAFLLCFVLVLSACLMTACGSKKKSSGETTESTSADPVEVTDPEARQVALASFLKGVAAARESGAIFSGSLKGQSTESVRDEQGEKTDAKKTEAFDLALDLKYMDGKFVATATGTVDGETGKFECYFDGTLIGMLSTGDKKPAGEESEEDKPDGNVIFLDDIADKIPMGTALPAGEDGDYTAVLDTIVGFLDLEKIAANVSAATANVITIVVGPTSVKVTVTSDAIFAEVLRILNIVKNAGDKKISAVIDEIAGAGTFAKLKTTLEKYHGTDTMDTVLPDLEKALNDAGIKVDAVYAFAAQMMSSEESAMTVEQLKEMINGYLVELTVNDAIGMVSDMFKGGNKAPEYGYEDEGLVEPLESEMPGAVGEEYEDGDGEVEEAMTYEEIVGMFLNFCDMTVNELIDSFMNPDFSFEGEEVEEEEDPTAETAEPADIAVLMAPVIAAVEAIKETIKFDVSVVCDKQLNPTKIELNVAIDSTKLPADMKDDGEFAATLKITAEIKASVTVAPSADMAALIAKAKEDREAVPEQE